MISFPEREAAAERAFVSQEDRAFHERAGRMRNLGIWAAQQLELYYADAKQYAEALAEMTAVFPDDARIVEQVELDLSRAGIMVQVGR
jgi:hypothetical protein